MSDRIDPSVGTSSVENPLKVPPAAPETRNYTIVGDTPTSTIYTPPEAPIEVPTVVVRDLPKQARQRFTVQVDIYHGHLTPDEVQNRVRAAFDDLKVVDYAISVAKG